MVRLGLMPYPKRARARRHMMLPEPLADPEADLAALALALGPDAVEAFAQMLDGSDLAIFESALAEHASAGWRSSPDAMAAHLDPTYRRWPYIRMLGQLVVEAVTGTEHHHIVNLPSQYGKTTSLMWGVVWLLDRDPTTRVLYVSYDSNRAEDVAGDVRDLAERHSDALRFQLRPDRRARGQWKTDEGGGLYATGINGAITGYPADALFLDDLIKGWQAAHSEAQRAFVWHVWQSQLRMRVQGGQCPIFQAGTRWHEDDMHGRLLAKAAEDSAADQWKHTRLPALAEADDPLGRAPGEALEPERFPLVEVLTRAATLGSYLAASLEQQRPAPEEGGEILRAWWRWVDAAPVNAQDWLSSWDMKLKDRESGDYVAGQVWARNGSSFTMCDQFRGQWSQAITRVAIALCQVRWPACRRHVIENTGYGPEVIDELRRPAPNYQLDPEVGDKLGMSDLERMAVTDIIRRGLPGLIPNNPKHSKAVRLRAISPLIEAGNVYLVTSPGADVLVNEGAAFPNGDHDDTLDAMSQALVRLSKGGAKVSSGAGQRLDVKTGSQPLKTLTPSIGGRGLRG